MKSFIEKAKEILKKAIFLVFNPRFLLCFGVGWLITNGWAYIMFALGTYIQSGWMLAVSGAYLTILWIPMSPEKIVTVTIAILLMRKFFPDDEKTLGILRELYEKAKIKKKSIEEKIEDKRHREHAENEKNGDNEKKRKK